MRRLDANDSYPIAETLTGEVSWTENLDGGELTEALRSSLHERYADASDEEVDDALANVLDSMSPAEAVNFTSALNRIGKSASQLISDPAFASVVQAALPVLGGAAGTMIGGPVGTALGSKLGSLAASALPVRPASAPAAAAPVAATPMPASPVTRQPSTLSTAAVPVAGAPTAAAPAPSVPATARPASPPIPESVIAGGSAAAAQGLVLTQQSDVLRCLLATALGQHGRQTVSGIPAAQVLELLSEVFGRAAADADRLMYLERQPNATESLLEEAPADVPSSLYTDLLGADNLELTAATGRDWLER